MVTVLIGASGSGKTFLLKKELVRKESICKPFIGKDFKLKDICVIERPQFNEYSHLFHPDYIKVIKPDSDAVNSLLDAKDMNIIIDCDFYEAQFMEKVSVIVKNAEKQNNHVTITFPEVYDDICFEKEIIAAADEVLVGECLITSEVEIEKIFGTKLEPVRRDFDFREVRCDNASFFSRFNGIELDLSKVMERKENLKNE